MSYGGLRGGGCTVVIVVLLYMERLGQPVVVYSSCCFSFLWPTRLPAVTRSQGHAATVGMLLALSHPLPLTRVQLNPYIYIYTH